MLESQLEESKAFNEFKKILHNSYTRASYLAHLRKYRKYVDSEKKGLDYDYLINRDNETIQEELEKYLDYLKNEPLRPDDIPHSKAYIKLAFSGIVSFYEWNKKTINKYRLSKLVGKEENKNEILAYTTEDIKKILDAIDKVKLKKHRKYYYTKPRARAMVLFLASSGCRIGGMTSVRIRDVGYNPDTKKCLEKIDGCYSVKVYAGTTSEYLTFLTPQASQAIDDWLGLFKDKFRPYEENGKIVNFEDCYLFDLDRDSAYLFLWRLVKRANLGYIKNGHRYPKPLNHAYRYRWNTILKINNNLNHNLVEMMLGHHVIALDKSYLKPTREQLFAEYRKIIKELSIH